MCIQTLRLINSEDCIQVGLTSSCQRILIQQKSIKNHIKRPFHSTIITGQHETNLSKVFNNKLLPCHRHGGIMTKLLKDSGQFLFPCMIEHSLICAAVLTVMWTNVNVEHKHFVAQWKLSTSTRHRYSISRLRKATALAGTWPLRPTLPPLASSAFSSSAQQHESRRLANHYSVDCSHATTGLFCGLLVMASVLISLIVFFTLSKENLAEPAILIAQYSQLVLYCVSMVAVIIAMQQVIYLHSDSKLTLRPTKLVSSRSNLLSPTNLGRENSSSILGYYRHHLS